MTHKLLSVLLISLTLAACASTGDSLDQYLEPPSPLPGLTEVNALYRREAVYLTGLHDQWQRHMALRTDKRFPEHNRNCARYLAEQIRSFSWTGYRNAFEDTKQQIDLYVSQQHCDEARPQFIAKETTEQSATNISPEQARVYDTVDAFIENAIASNYGSIEKKRVDWQDLKDNDIYLYRVFVPGKDMLQGLIWPRNALQTYCTAQGGVLEEDLYVDGYLLVKRARTPQESLGLTRAIEAKAYGKKYCVDNGVLRWGVFIGPGRMTGSLPTNLKETHLPLEQRTYTSEMTLHINTGMFKELQGLPYKTTITGKR